MGLLLMEVREVFSGEVEILLIIDSLFSFPFFLGKLMSLGPVFLPISHQTNPRDRQDQEKRNAAHKFGQGLQQFASLLIRLELLVQKSHFFPDQRIELGSQSGIGSQLPDLSQIADPFSSPVFLIVVSGLDR